MAKKVAWILVFPLFATLPFVFLAAILGWATLWFAFSDQPFGAIDGHMFDIFQVQLCFSRGIIRSREIRTISYHDGSNRTEIHPQILARGLEGWRDPRDPGKSFPRGDASRKMRGSDSPVSTLGSRPRERTRIVDTSRVLPFSFPFPMIDDGSFALILLVLGFALVVAEVFIPSGGIILIGVVLTFAASIFFAHSAWWSKTPSYFWIFLGSLLVLIPSFVIGLFRTLDRTSLGDRILLQAPTDAEVRPYHRESERLSALIGQRGETVTLLTPGGLVKVQNERLHCVSEGIMIPAGESVEIVGVQGTRLLVRTIDPHAKPLASDVFLEG